MPTSVKENYLKALYFLNEKDHLINITELSKKLGVSKPTASNMVKSLQEHGWVIYQKYKPVKLTEKGRIAGAKVIRKHRLTEMFLHKIMDFGWEEVHEIAEQMEHITSEKLFTRMDEMLDHPTLDPHGSPIPDKDGNIVERQLQTLISIPLGTKGILRRLAKSSSELLQYLNKYGIELGTVIQLIKVETFDNSCTISCNDQTPIMISQKVGENLLVEMV